VRFSFQELLKKIAEERNYSEDEVGQDLAVLHGKRLRTVGDLRVLSEASIKELGLPPVVYEYLLRVAKKV
jgi:hypothetical protein